MSKKDCAFQFIITKDSFLRDYENVEDTGLITYSQAKKLWEQHLPRFIKALKDEYESPEMAIWVNMKNNTDYHTAKPHVDNDTKFDGRRLYNEVKEYIEL